MDPAERTARLERAYLYLVCDLAAAERVLAAALESGVDVFQLREKHAARDQLLAGAASCRAQCERHGALFVVNDDPELALAAGADGVHLGQDDVAPSQARAIVGDELLIGRSTHSEQQIDAAADVDYIGVGPVHATPTKPGRLPVGVELVRYAARHARVPFFAIGGIERGNVAAVRAAGGERIAVVRAIAEAADPGAAARELARSLVGSA
jgi:thiamine-phosphate pyrophosphorylase